MTTDYLDDEHAYDEDDASTIHTESTVMDIEDEEDDEKYKRNPNLKKIKSKPGRDCYKVKICKRVKRRKKGKVQILVKQVPLNFYETASTTGATIRDAITGQYHIGYHVGKYDDENQFFKTAYCIGDAVKEGQKIGDNRDPQFLYYMNPESYERHFNIRMKPENKEKWYNMQIDLKNKRISNSNNSNL